MIALGLLILIERRHYVGVYYRSINRGPFTLRRSAALWVVVATGVLSVMSGLVVGILTMTQAVWSTTPHH
jgi:hypothetical protein